MKRLDNNLNNLNEVHALLSNQNVATELVTFLCGEKIGEGAFRNVYDFNLDPTKVIKIEHGQSDCNIVEYTLWDEIQGLHGSLAWVKDWFAPIHYCSPNGRVLIMSKTKQLNKKRPTKVPDFFMDVKESNFGWIGNKFVCHDYGFINRFIKYEKKYRKVVW